MVLPRKGLFSCMMQEDTSYFLPLEGVNTPQANNMPMVMSAAAATAATDQMIFFFKAVSPFADTV